MMGKIILLLIIVLNLREANSQSTLILDATKDTYINTVIADQVQGQVQSLIAAGWTYGGSYGQGRSLLGYELCELPDSFVLVSATLHLYFDYSSGHAGHTASGLNSAKLYKTTSYWDESTTWSSQPTFDLSTFSSLPASTTTSQDYTVDVTGIVNNCISTSNEVGFYFKLDDEQTYRSLVFASKDHPDPAIRPKLELVYYTDTTWCNNPANPSGPTDPGPNPTPTEPVDICVSELLVPNVFTPNGDLINDEFLINPNCEYSSFHVDIVNRWGELVYSSDDIDFVWKGKNGTSKDEVTQGTYFYKMTFSKNKKISAKSGFIELIR